MTFSGFNSWLCRKRCVLGWSCMFVQDWAFCCQRKLWTPGWELKHNEQILTPPPRSILQCWETPQWRTSLGPYCADHHLGSCWCVQFLWIFSVDITYHTCKMFFTRSKKYKLTQSLDLGMYAEVWDLNPSINSLSHQKSVIIYMKRNWNHI